MCLNCIQKLLHQCPNSLHCEFYAVPGSIPSMTNLGKELFWIGYDLDVSRKHFLATIRSSLYFICRHHASPYILQDDKPWHRSFSFCFVVLACCFFPAQCCYFSLCFLLYILIRRKIFQTDIITISLQMSINGDRPHPLWVNAHSLHANHAGWRYQRYRFRRGNFFSLTLSRTVIKVINIFNNITLLTFELKNETGCQMSRVIA